MILGRSHNNECNHCGPTKDMRRTICCELGMNFSPTTAAAAGQGEKDDHCRVEEGEGNETEEMLIKGVD